MFIKMMEIGSEAPVLHSAVSACDISCHSWSTRI